MVRELARARELPRRTAAGVRRAVPHLQHGAARPPGQDLSGRDGREPVGPWGNTKEEREGYHLVWPRDLVECAGALLAVGATREAGNTLRYLLATQLADGHWYQNQYLGSKPYWTGVQLDETALPVLLAALLAERDALEGHAGRGHGQARAVLHRAARSGERPGSLGGERGAQHLHARGLHRRAGDAAQIISSPMRASWRSTSRITGIRGSRIGPRCAIRRSRGNLESPAITCASRRLRRSPTGAHSIEC